MIDDATADFAPESWQYDPDDAVIYDNSGREALTIFIDTDADSAGIARIDRNANLAALAPELLFALALLTDGVETEVSIFGAEPQKESRLGIARAVLAKWKDVIKGDPRSWPR